MLTKDLTDFLNRKVDEYNRPSFIRHDPVSVPHLFSRKQDIEIAGFFSAIFSWGNRTTIISKGRELMELMDNSPHQFIVQHATTDLKRFARFKHRTFNLTDLLYFIEFLKYHYSEHKSLEYAFSQWINKNDTTTENALNGFYSYFFSLEENPPRTHKHIAAPKKGSTCKRINMFLRWMVRSDDKGVDFGIWKKIQPSQLICPIDLHVARVAKKLTLLTRNQLDWQAAIELTDHLRNLDEQDPVKYDFALFGLGALELK